MDEKKTLFELIGGRPALQRVHKLFYDKVYANPELKHYFANTNQVTIEEQQTNFMTGKMGGGKIFTGKTPENCHVRMFITKELFDLRNNLLKESILEYGISGERLERWMAINNAFERAIVKNDPSECKKRFLGDEILYPANWKRKDT